MIDRRAALGGALGLLLASGVRDGAAAQAPAPADKRFQTSYRILFNSDLVVESDLRHFGAIAISPADLVTVASWALEGKGAGAGLISTVADGRSSHMVTLQGYSRQTNAFEYWEPRGTDSFLQSHNNIAGVNATPDPNRRKFWYISRGELERVLYAYSVGFRDALWLNSRLAMGAFAKLGDRLAEARASAFFHSSHLEEASRRAEEKGRSIIVFRPSQGTAQDQAGLAVTVTADDRILDVMLVLRRAFVDDPATARTAADICKSLIESATAVEDAPFLRSLIEALKPLAASAAEAADTALPTGLAAYRGQAPAYEQPLSRSWLRIANRTTGQTPELVISLTTTH